MRVAGWWFVSSPNAILLIESPLLPPYYCQIAEEPRVSKSAVEFFQAWLQKAAQQIESSDQSQASKVYVEAARGVLEKEVRGGERAVGSKSVCFFA